MNEYTFLYCLAGMVISGVLCFIVFWVVNYAYNSYKPFINKFVEIENDIEESYTSIDWEKTKRENIVDRIEKIAMKFLDDEMELNKFMISVRQHGGDTILVTHESYPKLMSHKEIQYLIKCIEHTEKNIVSQIRYYNRLVNNWNTIISAFPHNYFAGMRGYVKKDYLEYEPEGEI